MTTEDTALAEAGAPIRLPAANRGINRTGRTPDPMFADSAAEHAAYVLPRAAGGVRTPARRSRFSARGTANLRLATGKDVLVDFESVLELSVAYLAASHPQCVDIRSQAFSIQYLDSSKRVRHHVVDFLITLLDGRRLALIVKPAAKAQDPEFRAQLAAISAALPRPHADELVLVTDASFDRSATLNAARYMQFSRTIDAEAEQATLSIIRDLNGAIELGALAKMTAYSGRAYRAAYCFVFRGLLKSCGSGLITPSTIVTSMVSS